MRPAAPSSAVVMARVRAAYLASSLSYAEIGARMGYKDRRLGKEKAYQFVNLVRQPSAVKLARFALAVGVPIATLLARPRSPEPVTR